MLGTDLEVTWRQPAGHWKRWRRLLTSCYYTREWEQGPGTCPLDFDWDLMVTGPSCGLRHSVLGHMVLFSHV